MKLFGRKPSQLRKDVIQIALALAAVTAIIATTLVGLPQVAAVVGVAGGLTTAFNLVAAALQRSEVAKAIDGLDDTDDVATAVTAVADAIVAVAEPVGCCYNASGAK